MFVKDKKIHSFYDLIEHNIRISSMNYNTILSIKLITNIINLLSETAIK